jgi:large subunit ribosomal protein L10
MLNRAQKDELIKGIKTDIENAKAVYLTNLIGVTANESVAIRKSVRDAGGKLVVTRNTLFRKGSEGTPAEALLKELKGPHAIAFAFEDAAAVAKCLKDAGDDHEVVDLKGGLLNGEELSKAQLVQLANLPSRDQMLATLLATFNAPIGALARVLHAIGEQKAEGGEAPAAEAAPAEAEAAPAEEKPE